MQPKFKLLSLSIMTAVGLTACGGGSGSGGNNDVKETQTKVTTSIVATDAYGNSMASGIACLDADNSSSCDENEVQAPIADGKATLEFVIPKDSNESVNAQTLNQNELTGSFLAYSEHGVYKFSRRAEGLVSDLPATIDVNAMTTAATDCSFDSSCSTSYDGAVRYLAEVIGTTFEKLIHFTRNPAERAFFGSLEANRRHLTPDDMTSGNFRDAVKDIASAQENGKTRQEIENYLKSHGNFAGVDVAEDKTDGNNESNNHQGAINHRPTSDGLTIDTKEPTCTKLITFTVENPYDEDGETPKICWKFAFGSAEPVTNDPELNGGDPSIPDLGILSDPRFTCGDSASFEATPYHAGVWHVTSYLKDGVSAGGLQSMEITVGGGNLCRDDDNHEDQQEVEPVIDASFVVAQDQLEPGLIVFSPIITSSELKYHWNFGDGESSDGIVVTHEYKRIDSYNITLTITTKDGKTFTKEQSFFVPFVNNTPIVVECKAQIDASFNRNLIFESKAAPGSGEYFVEWDFGDGQTSTEYAGVHFYGSSNLYNVTARIYNRKDELVEEIAVGEFVAPSIGLDDYNNES